LLYTRFCFDDPNEGKPIFAWSYLSGVTDISNTAKGIFFLLFRQGDKTASKQLVLQ